MSRRVILTSIGLAIGGITLFQLLGYSYANSMYDAVVLAEQFVKEQSNPKRCLKIKTFLPSYPSVNDLRSMCLRVYAKESQNTDACYLLDHKKRLACGESIAQKIRNGEGCLGWEETINCSLDLVVPNQGVEDCGIYKDREVRDWCRQERTATLEGVYECDQLESDSAILKDECIRQYALKLRSAAECQSILNDDLQKACELQVEYIDY